MASKTPLEKPISRFVRLGDDEYEATLSPEDGGQLVLRRVGDRGRDARKSFRLAELLERAEGLFASGPAVAPKAVQDADPDLIDLGALEPLIMIEAPEFTPDVKGKLWSIVRDIRNDRREEMGLKPVGSRE